MFHADTRQKIEEELARGEAARRDGFEGRARVCARRAAGTATRAYFEQRGLPVRNPSAYELLADLLEQQGLSPQMREAAEHLRARVDENFALPAEMDLLADARRIIEGLDGMLD